MGLVLFLYYMIKFSAPGLKCSSRSVLTKIGFPAQAEESLLIYKNKTRTYLVKSKTYLKVLIFVKPERFRKSKFALSKVKSE